jgi:hypothetical protein
MRIGQALARDGAPGFEPLAPGGERADTRLHAVGDDQQRARGEERRDFGFVGLELLEGRPDRGILVRRVFELYDRQRQAVDEEHDVRSAAMLVLRHGELVDRQPVVGGRVLEVQHPRLGAADLAVGRAVLHRHPVHQQAMHRTVARRQLRTLGPGKLAEGVVQRCGGKAAVELCERVAQALFQDDLPIVVALCG